MSSSPVAPEPKVMVCVRHSILGVIKRDFRPSCNVVALYDLGDLTTFSKRERHISKTISQAILAGVLNRFYHII